MSNRCLLTSEKLPRMASAVDLGPWPKAIAQRAKVTTLNFRVFISHLAGASLLTEVSTRHKGLAANRVEFPDELPQARIFHRRSAAHGIERNAVEEAFVAGA